MKMRVCWWQGGLHLQPESKAESEALDLVTKSLHAIEVDQCVSASPISGNFRNENSVVRMHEGVQVIPDL